MPLSVNVGLSRKASKDYQSTGTSINIVAELDSALLNKPAELQQAVDRLYQHARQALDRHSIEPAPRPLPAQPAHSPVASGRDAQSGNGNGQNHNGRGMTASQRRAIAAIAKRMGVDPASAARRIIGQELENLSIRQASELIDHLQSLQLAESGRNGNGR